MKKYITLLVSVINLWLGQSVAQAKLDLTHEVEALGFKFLLGLALTGAFLISLIQAGYAFHLLLATTEHGLVLELTTFGLIGLLSVSGLLFLSSSKPPKKEMPITKAPMPPIDINQLAIHFITGIKEGMKQSDSKSKTPPN